MECARRYHFLICKVNGRMLKCLVIISVQRPAFFMQPERLLGIEACPSSSNKQQAFIFLTASTKDCTRVTNCTLFCYRSKYLQHLRHVSKD